MDECIFCKIANGQSPAQVEFEDDKVIVFWDMQPLAPIHLLVVPKKHITSLTKCTEQDAEILGHMTLIATKIAHDKNLDDDGYRLVINQGVHGGQIVEHLHMHLIGGTQLGKMLTTEAKPELS